MAVYTFASIYIGSYELSLKVFEFTAKKKLKEIEHVRARIDLGKDVYRSGIVGYEAVDQICEILAEYQSIIKSYRANAYEVFASSAMRDAKNQNFVLNQIEIRTGIQVKLFSNSEQRFFTYETVAGMEQFEKMIQKSAAVVDIGGTGIQITLFKGGNLITTQHMELGTLRLQNLLMDAGVSTEMYQLQLQEYISKKIDVFSSMYLDGSLESIVFINDYCEQMVRDLHKHYVEDRLVKAERFLKYADKLQKQNNKDDSISLPALVLFQCLVKSLGVQFVFAPGTNINDGIAFDFARQHNLLKIEHDFEADILSAAMNLAEHFNSYTLHIEALQVLAGQIFDAMKKVHGLGKRQYLLLKVATLLHDVGKYVSLANSPKSAYNIIMESEIIGLSHIERQIVAYTVLLNASPDIAAEQLDDPIDKDSFLIAAKLSAILRVANALDQSHKQKFQNVKIAFKDRQLVITVEALEDISLEKALFTSKTDYFETVFSLKPILKEKRVYSYKQ